ncbi:MAG: hypothetical protein EXR98_08205 [Gemmataceae bacterium]|nr:hypothetical protein [Gemmataceae bacterium]
MMVLDEIEQRRRTRRKVKLPESRPSILDSSLDSEPWLGQCLCSETLVLFLHNYPVAFIPGTALDFNALSARLYQLRHRWPRQ